MGENKNARGSAAQFYVAGELCRRDLVAVVTMGNTPNTDILCSDTNGTKFVHIQVKTYVPKNKKVTVGIKAEKDYGSNFIWVLAGIPRANSKDAFEFYVIPSPAVAKNVSESHKKYISELGKKGQIRKDSTMRVICLPPTKSENGWDISEYKNRWDIIESLLK